MNAGMNAAAFDRAALLETLQTQATLDAIREFLKKKGLASSATSWERMIGERIVPFLDSGSITPNDIIEVIREAEEHGRKHVFLYVFPKTYAAALQAALSASNVDAWAAKSGIINRGTYLFTTTPTRPTITELRIGDGASIDALIIKVARTEHRRTRPQLKFVGGVESYVSERVPFRAVDVLKVHSSGLVEVRMTPRTEASTSYTGIARSLITNLVGLLDINLMQELSLTDAKTSLSDQRKPATNNNFELYEALHRNGTGDKIQSSAIADQGGIHASPAMISAIEAFNNFDPANSYCQRVRVSYQRGKLRKITAILSDELNEIIFTAALSRSEYEEILDALLAVNR